MPTDTILNNGAITTPLQSSAPAVDVRGGVRMVEWAMEATREVSGDDPSAYAEHYAGIQIRSADCDLMTLQLCAVSSPKDGSPELVQLANIDITRGCIPVLAQVFAEAARQVEAHDRYFVTMPTVATRALVEAATSSPLSR